LAQLHNFLLQVTKVGGLAQNSPLGGNNVAWDAPNAANIAASDLLYNSTFPPAADQEYSDFLQVRNFGFTIPLTATIDAIEVRIRRKARGTGIKDNRLMLMKAGVMVGADYAETSNAWGANNSTALYDGDGGIDPLWSESWTPADINAPDFGLQLAIWKDGGLSVGDFADVNLVQISISYTALFPIVLTNFDVKSVDNKVSISFTTESETKVKTLFIERSADGKNYTDLFAIAPKGAENIKTTYNLTDAAPLLGTNYYRLKEIDIDGKWHYYETRVVKTTSVNNKFQAYQNGSNVMVNFNNLPGAYTATLIDMNGAIVAKQSFKVDKQSVQISLSPTVARTGVYLVNLKGGDGFNQSLKVFIQR
jgi:hypothetical protein